MKTGSQPQRSSTARGRTRSRAVPARSKSGAKAKSKSVGARYASGPAARSRVVKFRSTTAGHEVPFQRTRDQIRRKAGLLKTRRRQL